tara:strand:+ start:324 stop:584 length:261 start_codon:yes stop_codon:yes gene_type:complete
MDRETIEGIAFFSATATTVCFAFQAIKVLKSKRTRDISFLMYLVFTCGTIGWIVFGHFAQHPAIFWSNIITTSLAIYILISKVKYG